MTFGSILFLDPADRDRSHRAGEPDCFPDLNLDQIIAGIAAGREEYDLPAFFYVQLQRPDAVLYRHAVFRDLEAPDVLATIRTFAAAMRSVREHLGRLGERFYDLQKERWFLDAVDLYGDAVQGLGDGLARAAIRSRGLSAFRDYVAGYAASGSFTTLNGQAKQLKTQLASIRYRVFVRGPRVEVRAAAGEADYSREVEDTFERFGQDSGGGYDFKFSTSPEMNHIEAQILDGVAKTFPQIFSSVAAYVMQNASFLDETIVAFDREIHFYLAYIDFLASLKKAGLIFAYPEVVESRDGTRARDAFDLALAAKLIKDGKAPVRNDFALDGPERILVVSGPNQGGKTTFARTFGQLHYLASLGCPVPATAARLFLSDAILTHFEREERMTNHRGKLEDDLVRIHDILGRATPRTIIVINEIFASTTLRDAVLLAKRVAEALMRLDALCVWVTFLDEIASLGPQTVSMVSTVVPDNPAERTFKIVRRSADGLAYAMSIAEKHRLTYAQVKERVADESPSPLP